MQPNIEDIIARFNSMSPARGQRWNIYPLRPDRLFISRDDEGGYAIFLKGTIDTFQALLPHPGMEHRDDVVALPTGTAMSALRLTCGAGPHANRAMAHIAYELERKLAENPTIANEALLADASWIMSLLGEQPGLMTVERQRGLVGELLLLRRLLLLGHELKVPLTEVLARWWGSQPAKRDFAARGVAIEVKTTSTDIRLHHVGSLSQLDPHGDEEVFLYSVGIRLDASAPRKLPHLIEEVESVLVKPDGEPDAEARRRLEEKLLRYGYDRSHQSYYLGTPGILNYSPAPRLFRESTLQRLRLTSFKGDALPSMVTNVAYEIDVTAPELTDMEEREVLTRLLTLPALEA